MQQRTRRLAIVIGGALISAIGVLAACSTDNGTTPLPTTGGDSGGRDSSKADSTTPDEETDGGSTKDAASAADCGLAPHLRTNDQGGFFCAFFTRDAAAGDAGAGGNRNCSDNETCCNPGKGGDGKFPPSFCATTPEAQKSSGNGQTACSAQANANGSTWNAPNSTTWQCGDSNNCDDGEVCCMFTWLDAGATDKVNIGNSLDTDIPKSCGALQAFKAGGTHCAASCDTTEIKLCSKSDDNCTGNQKCTPFSATGRDLGYCK